jgi:hypothetical protein
MRLSVATVSEEIQFRVGFAEFSKASKGCSQTGTVRLFKVQLWNVSTGAVEAGNVDSAQSCQTANDRLSEPFVAVNKTRCFSGTNRSPAIC